MKRFTILCCFLAISFAAMAQKSMPEGQSLSPVKVTVSGKATCPDFTITTTDGVVRNLYTVLNAGKAVLLDQFYTTCSYCQTYAPIIDDAYVNHGSGAGDIEFWGIDQGDTDAEVIAYKATYGVSNPCASGTQGGGNAADAALISANGNFTGYPTYSIVCPNKTVSWDVNYPPSVNGFNTYFTNCGVTAIAEQENGIKLDRVFPVPATDQVNFEITVDVPGNIQFEIYDIMGQLVYSHQADYTNGVFVINVDVTSFANGAYVVKMIKSDTIAQIFRFSVAK